MLVPPRHLFWVLLLGITLLLAISLAQGIMGQQRRERLAQLSISTFGRTGATLINLLMAIGLVGWSGFHGGVSGASVAALFNLSGWLGALLVFVFLFLLNSLGINRWAALTWVTTGAALALTVFALVSVGVDGGSTPQATVMVPSTLTAGTVLLAVSTIIGYATLFSLRTPDFTWDFATAADVVKVQLFLFFPLLFAMGVGAYLFHATGNWNIADILAQTQSAALGHIFLIVAVVSPLISGWYSGAFALSYLTPLKPNQSILLICLLGYFLAATRFDQQLLPFLGYLGASLGPALAILLIIHGRRPSAGTQHALIAWLAGAIPAIILHAQGQAYHLFVGAGVAVGILMLLRFVGK